jgi:DNA-binding transcriptional LysR family regulator
VERYFANIGDADIRLLRIFNVVVAAGGLSMATSELDADLSTVSRYIKELEDRVGARLCNRGRAGFSLTAHGVQVHNAAQDLFMALQTFQDNINAMRSDPVGQLRIGIMDALISDPQFLLSDALARHKLRAPRVRLHLSSAKPNDIERALLTGDLDCGIVASHDRMAGLRYQELYQETSGLYCSERHPYFSRDEQSISLGDAAELELVVDPYTESLPVRSPSSLFQKTSGADSLEAAALLVRTGRFVAFLPDHYAAALGAHTRLRSIRPDLFGYAQGIELAYRIGNGSPLVRGFLGDMGVPALR